MKDISYPVIISKDKGETVVQYPDFNVNPSYVEDGEDIIGIAKDVISLCLYDMKEDEYPKPSEVGELSSLNGTIVYVNLWLPYQFSQIKNIYKSKTITLPTWLDELGKEKNINFSQVLQNALKKELGISS